MSVTINGTTGIVSPHIETTTSSAGSADIGVLNGGQFAFRNKVINGKMEIAQRGTSFPAIATGTYSLDRWKVNYVTAGAATVSQQAIVPASNEFQNSIRVEVTTADVSIAAGDVYLLSQAVEGFNIRDLIGRAFTLSFWVRSSKSGVHCVRFCNSGADRTYVAEYTVNTANTWEYKTITVSSGLITTGTWNWTNGAGLLVSFAIAAGTNFQTTPNVWQTGNFVATSNQVNVLDTVGNTFYITGVQLEVGEVATPFEHRPYGTELALCQRYYQKSTGGGYGLIVVAGGTFRQFMYYFKVEMRAAPTCVCTWYTGTPGTQSATTTGVEVFANVGDTTTSSYLTGLTANAEL